MFYFEVKNYDWLVNGTAQTQLDTFLNEEHSFDEYTKVKIPKDEPISFYVWLNHVLVYLLLYATLPIKASGGVSYAVKRDCQPYIKSLLPNGSFGL